MYYLFIVSFWELLKTDSQGEGPFGFSICSQKKFTLIPKVVPSKAIQFGLIFSIMMTEAFSLTIDCVTEGTSKGPRGFLRPSESQYSALVLGFDCGIMFVDVCIVLVWGIRVQNSLRYSSVETYSCSIAKLGDVNRKDNGVFYYL